MFKITRTSAKKYIAKMMAFEDEKVDACLFREVGRMNIRRCSSDIYYSGRSGLSNDSRR